MQANTLEQMSWRYEDYLIACRQTQPRENAATSS
jgi:hypothetical protein